jgi:hypothetical protein
VHYDRLSARLGRLQQRQRGVVCLDDVEQQRQIVALGETEASGEKSGLVGGVGKRLVI